MTLDFRKDVADLFALIESAVNKYASAHASPKTAKKHPPVSRIDLVYRVGPPEEGSFVLLNLDTRPGAEPDGEWSHEEYATLERPHWSQTAAVLSDEKTAVEFLMPDGKSRKLTGKAPVVASGEIYGQVLVTALKNAREAGLFKELPKLDRCEIGVEESGGHFGWPTYQRRGKENLA